MASNRARRNVSRSAGNIGAGRRPLKVGAPRPIVREAEALSVISLRRHMEAEHTSAVLLAALKATCVRALGAMGASAVRACPSADGQVERELAALGRRLADAGTPADIEAAGEQVRARLQHWADAVDDDLHAKAREVRELLVTLAATAASVAAGDAEHVMRFDALTQRLQRIATLEDVRELRSAVVDSAADLRASVAAMSSSTRAAVGALQAELTTYQARLEAAEQQAARDAQTGLLNRHRMERIIERRAADGQPFTLALLSPDDLEATCVRHGQRAGDDLLRQIAAELAANLRAGDVVGRWSADAFVVVGNSAGADARAHLDRLRERVGGRYTLEAQHGPTKVHVPLSMGLAEWRPGVTVPGVMDQAARALYAARHQGR